MSAGSSEFEKKLQEVAAKSAHMIQPRTTRQFPMKEFRLERDEAPTQTAGMSADIARVLAEHRYRGGSDPRACRCGHVLPSALDHDGNLSDLIAAHQAAVLAPLILRERAEAWDEGRRSANVMLPTCPPKEPSNPYRAAAIDPEGSAQ